MACLLYTSELSFRPEDRLPGLSFVLDGGMRMELQGRIDRVDLAFDGDRIYVKIIDYKSGMTGFEPARIYHGLQLQLMVYLQADVYKRQGMGTMTFIKQSAILQQHGSMAAAA